jgi:hypothetical protein
MFLNKLDKQRISGKYCEINMKRRILNKYKTIQDVQENLDIKLSTPEIMYKKDGFRRSYDVQILYSASVYTVELEGAVN